jgi:glutamate decarboxylase
LVWDFRLSLVNSINTSGHKYGLTYAGIGWAVWRDKSCLPDDLVFHIDYLGADQVSFTLNFSKSAAPIIAQYYMLIRMGVEGNLLCLTLGFTAVMKNIYSNCEYLKDGLLKLGWFKILSNIDPNKGLPVIAFSFVPKTEKDRHFDEFDLSRTLRQTKWIVPAYKMAKNVEHLKLLRVVVREDFSRNRVDLLLQDIATSLETLHHIDKVHLKVERERKSPRWGKLLTSIHSFKKDHQKSTGTIC